VFEAKFAFALEPVQSEKHDEHGASHADEWTFGCHSDPIP
jgi:hypothetical protein